MIEELLNKIKIAFKFATGFDLKGILLGLGGAFASLIFEVFEKIAFIEKQAFVSTADKEYLILAGGGLNEPVPASNASGEVLFYGTTGTNIATGTLLSDENNLEYRTIKDGTIATVRIIGTASISGDNATITSQEKLTTGSYLVNNVNKEVVVFENGILQFSRTGINAGDAVEIVANKALIEIESLDTGAAYNKPFNATLSLIVTEPDLNTDIGVIFVSNGKDEEDTEAFRLRLQNIKNRPEAQFNKSNIENSVKRVREDVRFMYIKGGEFQEGKIKIYALDFDLDLIAELSQEIFNIANEIRPAQMPSTAISVVKPIVLKRNVTITNLTPNSEELKTAITNNIVSFFNENNFFEEDIQLEKIEQLVFGSRTLKESVTTATVVFNGNKAVDTYLTLNDVVF